MDARALYNRRIVSRRLVKDTTPGLNNSAVVQGIIIAEATPPGEADSGTTLNKLDVQASAIVVAPPSVLTHGDSVPVKECGTPNTGCLSYLSGLVKSPDAKSLSQLMYENWVDTSLQKCIDKDTIQEDFVDLNTLVYPILISVNVGRPEDFDPDVNHNDDALDLQFSTKSLTAGMSYVSSLAEMLKKGGWWGLVCVELNPGPKSKAQVKSENKKKGKVHEVIKIVERSKKSDKGSYGQRIGKKVGGFIGDMAQKAIMTITGMGDYKVRKNSLYDGAITASSPPMFLSSENSVDGCRLRKREFIGNVTSPGAAFAIQTYAINPENPSSFPWLSSLALNYEQYKFHGLVYEFKTTSATAVASTNTALGAVILATQYNTLETPFVSKLQMEQYEYAVGTNPSVSAIHPIECDPRQGSPNFLYTDGQNVLSRGDPRLSLLGNFSIATEGQQASSVIGELWVSYDVEFMKCRLDQGVSTFAQDACYYCIPPATNQTFTMSVTNLFSNPSNGTWKFMRTSALPVTFGTVSSGFGNTILFAPVCTGLYKIAIAADILAAIGDVKTGTKQKCFNVSAANGQPWVSLAKVLVTNDVSDPSSNFHFESVTPYANADRCDNIREEYTFRIGNNAGGTQFLVTPFLPFDGTNKMITISVTISPLWYTDGNTG